MGEIYFFWAPYWPGGFYGDSLSSAFIYYFALKKIQFLNVLKLMSKLCFPKCLIQWYLIIDHSPYLSQSLGGQSTKSGPRRTGHEAWSTAIRNGFTGTGTVWKIIHIIMIFLFSNDQKAFFFLFFFFFYNKFNKL
jgi:hypothetical protein